MKLIIKSMLATGLALSAFAATPSQAQAPKAPAQMDPNPSARWGTKDRGNVFVTGEVVWFKPINGDFAKEITTDGVSPAADTVSYTMFQHVFKPGYRVALGYNTTYDGWDAVLSFTGFDYKHNNSYENVDVGVSSTSGKYGTISKTYYFYQGDLDFGRMFKVSRRLKLRPHVGVRALWLTQKTSINHVVNQLATAQSSNTARNKGTLIGAEMGLDTNWMLSNEFSVYANLGFATLVNSQKAEAQRYDADGVLQTSQYSNYGSKIVNGLDFAIGLRWDRNFSDDDYHLGINFGYEHHSLINVNTKQNMYTQDQKNLSNEYDPFGNWNDDFTMQGIALGARFDF